MQKKKLILSLILMFLLVLFIGMPSYAASFSISSAKSSLNVGGTTTLTINAKGCIGQFTIKSSDANVVSVSESSVWIDDATKTITLTAKKAGNATITVTASNASDVSGDNEVKGSQTKTITVTAPSSNTDSGKTTNSSKSSDATLKSITVGGKTYSKPSTSITAPNVSANTSSIKISATTNNSKATVKGTGTKDLKTGTNKFTLKVTAESGATKTYTVTILRLAEESQEPNLPDENKNEEPQAELRLTTLQIEGAEISPTFREDLFEYSAYIFDLDEIKINAVSNDQEAKIEIIGNTGLIDGENNVVIKVTKDDKSVEYKIKVTKMQFEAEESNTQNIIEEESKGFSFGDVWSKHGPAMILYSTILITTGVAIGFGITTYRNNNKKDKPISKHSMVDFIKEDTKDTKDD